MKKKAARKAKWLRASKAPVFMAKHFVLPYVVAKERLDASGFDREQVEAQRRLEEAVLLARWRRKHQPSTGGSRSAGRPGAACKHSSGKSRRASR